MNWNKEQKKAFAKEAKKRWGDGWKLLSKEQQEGVIARQILWVLRMQVDGAFDDIKDLIQGTMQEAGVWGD